MTRRLLLFLVGVLPLLAAPARAQEAELTGHGAAAPVAAPDGSEAVSAWQATAATPVLAFRPPDGWTAPAAGPLYAAVTYLDKGYGRLAIAFAGADGKPATADKMTRPVLLDSGKWVTCYARLAGIAPGTPEVKVSREKVPDHALAVAKVVLRPDPFPDAHFQYLLDEPWRRPYTGPVTPAPDNTTLQGKVMCGFQGWFRTPNDPSDRGWVHWGDMAQGRFSTDMWPDVSQYPPECLDKACDVKTLSGKPGLLFSSAWPEVERTQFRWMRENNIDGVFVQRFPGDNWAVNKTPQWVLGNVREAADREGRIWAIEYDLSGLNDEQALDHLRKDWVWLVDEFGILKDPNYARVNGKPVVFLWGMGVNGRHLSPETTAKLVDFFKNDPTYGGNYFIGGSSGNWRKLDPAWLAVFKTYDGILGWMSQDYADDLAQCKAWGIDYYPHVWPGFSWANLKHLPSASTNQYTPRDGGKVYTQRIAKALQAGVDRLFVGMFDEYDESTAIIPMSDDPPPTPQQAGTTAKFYANPKEQESAPTVHAAQATWTLDGTPPVKSVPGDGFLMRWEGEIVLPADGAYTFAVEGVPGDAVTLWIDDKKILDLPKLGEGGASATPVTLAAGKPAIYRVDYLHGSAHGAFQLLWQGPALERQAVPASAFMDAWGRFITNGGYPSDLYLKLTGEAREMLAGKRPVGGFSASP